MDWIAELGPITAETRGELGGLQRRALPKGLDLFAPGDRAQGFPLVLAGRVEVYLTGPSGREILLYAVEPGQSCIQTTLGLLGGLLHTFCLCGSFQLNLHQKNAPFLNLLPP